MMRDAEPARNPRELLIRAALYQEKLSQNTWAEEIIPQSTPILWFGEPEKKNWVTIATNPSTREFLGRNNELLLGEQSRFFVRNEGTSLKEYTNNDQELNETIEFYRTYFERKTAYRSWFGKREGGKLEGFLNGMGGSFYRSHKYKRVVHTDFFPISTKSQMGKLSQKSDLLDSDISFSLLRDILDFLEPSLIIVIGKEHCSRFERLEDGNVFGTKNRIANFPDACFQAGFSRRFSVPVVGLHFKPSEQFIGLGGGKDCNGVSHGEYARKAKLRGIGREVFWNLRLI